MNLINIVYRILKIKESESLNLEINQPYQIDDETDWFIPQHAETRQLPHCLIEIRNDQISDETGVSEWVKLLAEALNDLMKGL